MGHRVVPNDGSARVGQQEQDLITFWDPGTGTTVITPYVSRTLPSGQGKHVDAS
jgi:hypothetical protein